jgi:serine/threonine protein kinase
VPETVGRYELIGEIGRGGMATVKLAVRRPQEGYTQLFAIKVLHPEVASDPDIVDTLVEEAKLGALIQHPNVVQVFELGDIDGTQCIVMEYLEGESLLAILERCAQGKKLDPLSAARIIANAAEGLDAAHVLESRDGKPLRLVHHDVSLGNIMVLYSGQVKVLDFGVAKAAKKTGKVFGKLPYMAPEKLDDRPGDARSDIWSLGCVMWEALAHKRLFKGANDTEILREVRYVNVPPPSTVNADVPKELDPIVLRALQRDPSRRYQTAKEMATAIEAVLAAQQYPEKNYKIGTYMMQTFADHIAARERLLREVAGPHRPSAEVIEAAFGENAPPSRDSLPVLEDLLDLLSGSANVVVLPEGSTGADAMVAVSAANPFDEEEVPETIYDVVPANAEASRALRYEADPSWNRSKHGEKLKELQRKTQAMRDNPNGGPRRFIPIAVGGAFALLVVMIVAFKSCGSDAPKTVPVAKPADPAVVDAAVAAVAIDAPVDEVDAAVIEEEIEIEMPPEEASRPPDDDKPAPVETEKPRPKPTKSAQQYYAEGLRAWKKKDTRTAYALFTEGRRASSTYANNWYGLGLVHEKAGRKKDARVAYERYLKLAPNAPNTNKLRDHIKKNLM